MLQNIHFFISLQLYHFVLRVFILVSLNVNCVQNKIKILPEMAKVGFYHILHP